MKIGILQCDDVADELQTEFGNYPAMFEQMLGETASDFQFVTYRVADGELPESVHECDGYITTGSRHGVNDGFPWIDALEEFVVDLDRAKVKFVGICFGHQMLAKALEDGRDEEYVVCALLHDIGDTLGSLNHADLAATILQPFVSEQNYWMVKHHGIFQGYYFFHHLGKDRNMRDQFKDHEHFNYTAEFCHKYDQKAFDPDVTAMPLEDFVPMVERVFAQPKSSLYL